MHQQINGKAKSSVPLVSVGIATYNGEKYLREQLDSIYNQTYKNIEVVVVDDCSTDKTVEILKEYEKKHTLKYFINENNLGFLKNFEKVISLCQGEYIALSDQDDLWLPEKIETLVCEIGDNTLIYTPTIRYINEDGSLEKFPDMEIQIDYCMRYGSGKPTQRLIACNWVTSHQVLFKRVLCQFALPIPQGQHYHDAWLALVASKLNGIKFLNKELIYYRKNEGSVTYQNADFSDVLNPKFNYLFRTIITNKKLRIQENQAHVNRLKSILTLSLLDQTDQQFIKNLIYCYECRLKFGIHLRSFLISLQYVNLFVTFRNPFYFRFMFLAKSLIGQI